MAITQVATALLLAAPAIQAVNLQAHSTQDESCACLPWKDVYAEKGVRCGQGKELALFGIVGNAGAKSVLPSSMYDEFCTRFFMHSSHNACYNAKGFGPSDDQWCYVPAHCSSAGEAVAGTQVAMHQCSAAAGDDLMRLKAPEDLNRMAMKSGLEIGLFGKLSYTKSPLVWSKVEGASSLPVDKLRRTHVQEMTYGLAWSHPAAVKEGDRKALEDIIASGNATLFDPELVTSQYLQRSIIKGGTLIVGAKIYGMVPLTAGSNKLSFVCLQGC